MSESWLTNEDDLSENIIDSCDVVVKKRTVV